MNDYLFIYKENTVEASDRIYNVIIRAINMEVAIEHFREFYPGNVILNIIKIKG